MNRIAARLAKYKGSKRGKQNVRYLSEEEIDVLRARLRAVTVSFFSIEGLERDCGNPERFERMEPGQHIKTF